MGEDNTTYFVGEFVHALDAKGRVTIPSKWRISGGDNTYLALLIQEVTLLFIHQKWSLD